MNRKITSSSMVSSKGYGLERLSRHELRYRYGDKTLTLEIEETALSVGSFNRPITEVLKDVAAVLKAQKQGLVVYISKVRTWDAPYETEIIGEHELARIRDNIREGLNFLGIRCSFA